MDALLAMCAEQALVSPGALLAFREHAITEYPRECIGYLSNPYTYNPLRNMAEDARTHAVADHRLVSRLLYEGGITALLHSHPDGPDCPSELDMATQTEMDIPFIICSTNGTATTEPFAWGDDLEDRSPLEGRGFRHGVTDCYALIRSYWLRERGILLPDFPRNWEWWNDGTPGEKDLYGRHFRDAGFREIEKPEVQPGDVWLAAIRSRVPNHAGVVLPHGLALHHPSGGLPHDPTRLSKKEPLARWLPYVTHWLRRD